MALPRLKPLMFHSSILKMCALCHICVIKDALVVVTDLSEFDNSILKSLLTEGSSFVSFLSG